MRKADVQCKCGAIYTRIEVEKMQAPEVHQFHCGVCGRTLEAGVTDSMIGYKLTTQPELPLVVSPEV